MKKSLKKGFTLIELLVVVLILGILTAVALPSYLSSVEDSKEKATSTNARMIATAAQQIAVRTGLYPTTIGAMVPDLGGAIPKNACTGTALATDWVITGGTGGPFVVTPLVSGTCVGTPVTVSINP